jgi:hypothetical protein
LEMFCWPRSGAWLPSTTSSPAGRQTSIISAISPRFESVECDICEPFDLGKVDYVFHFASPASPVDCSIHGIPTLKVGRWERFMR